MAKPINIFIIYAREDKEIKQRILAYLNPFVKPYNLVIWHDDHIEPGQEWKPHINSRLNQTDLFVMLVSIDFMNSKFINQVEFKYAVERHKANKSIVIPVIINYCPWDIDFEFDDFTFNLSELQVLPDEGKPIDDWKTPAQAYNNVATGIRKVFASIKNGQQQQELEEDVFWNQVAQKNDISSYNEYLKNFPKGKFSEQARNEINILQEKEKEVLERNQHEIEKAQTESGRKKIEEEILWKSSYDSNTIAAYSNYLDKTELGLYGEQANTFIAEIENKNREILAEQERLLMQEQEDKLWEEATGENTIPAYEKYLHETKPGLFKEKAKELINHLQAEQKEKEIEQRFWGKTVTQNSLSSFGQYLQEYPNGIYKQEALTAISNIEEIKKNQEILAEQERVLKEDEENKLWEEATSENTIPAYEKYLHSTTLGVFKEKAQELINQLEAYQKEKEQEQQSWQTAKTENTINSYNGYLQHYPNGMYSTDASAAVKQIEEAERKQQEKLVEPENVPALEIERKGGSKKYFLIGGVAVLIVLIVLVFMNYTTPATEKVEIINAVVDTTALASQETTDTDTQQSQIPPPPVNFDSVSDNVNQANNSPSKADTSVSTFNGNADISTEEKKHNKDSSLINNTLSKKTDNPSVKSKSVKIANENSEIKDQNTKSPYDPNDIVKTLDLHVSINYNDIVQTGNDNYAFSYYLTGDNAMLNEIRSVGYQRLPLDWFSNPNFQYSKSRSNKFMLKLYQWGVCETVNVIVTLKDGSKSDIDEKVVIYDNKRNDH